MAIPIFALIPTCLLLVLVPIAVVQFPRYYEFSSSYTSSTSKSPFGRIADMISIDGNSEQEPSGSQRRATLGAPSRTNSDAPVQRKPWDPPFPRGSIVISDSSEDGQGIRTRKIGFRALPPAASISSLPRDPVVEEVDDEDNEKEEMNNYWFEAGLLQKPSTPTSPMPPSQPSPQRTVPKNPYPWFSQPSKEQSQHLQLQQPPQPQYSSIQPPPPISPQPQSKPEPGTPFHTSPRSRLSSLRTTALILAILVSILAFAVLIAQLLSWFIVYKTEARLGEARRGLLKGGEMRLCLCAR